MTYPCGSHRQCYETARREVTAAAKIMVEHAHALEGVSDRAMAGLDPGRMPRDSNDRCNEASTRLNANLPDMSNHSFWGFGFKSAADMEVQHARLEWCDQGTRAVRGLLLDVASGRSRDMILINLGAVATFLPECEAALGIKPQQTRVRAAMAEFVASCPRGSADRRAVEQCDWLNVRDERLKEARATRNSDQERLPEQERRK